MKGIFTLCAIFHLDHFLIFNLLLVLTYSVWWKWRLFQVLRWGWMDCWWETGCCDPAKAGCCHYGKQLRYLRIYQIRALNSHFCGIRPSTKVDWGAAITTYHIISPTIAGMAEKPDPRVTISLANLSDSFDADECWWLLRLVSLCFRFIPFSSKTLFLAVVVLMADPFCKQTMQTKHPWATNRTFIAVFLLN